MTPMTVVLCNWHRRFNMGVILSAVRRQTIRPIIHLWDNSETSDGADLDVDRYGSDPSNPGPVARWRFIDANVQTPLVCVIDDDLTIADPDLLADAAAHVTPGRIIGPHGAIIGPGLTYQTRQDVSLRDADVDVIKTRLAILRTADVPHAMSDGEDDIELSGRVACGRLGQHRTLALFGPGRLIELPSPDARWHRPNHFADRTAAARRYFRSPSCPSST